MRKAKVLYKGEEAGEILQNDEGAFLFRYNEEWVMNEKRPSISLTFPKKRREFRADNLFPFFYNMLPEGTNKRVVCKYMKIDWDDHFGLLLTVGTNDTIGAVTVTRSQA